MISTIVPTYQSEETIESLYLRLRSVLESLNRPYQMVFIDDASEDGTAAFLGKISEQNLFVTTIFHKKNVGQHRSVIEGLKQSKGEIMIVLDADLQDTPEEIPRLLTQIEAGYEAVFAGRRGSYESQVRLLTSKIFKFFLHRISSAPRDAGMFVALTKKMVQSVLSIQVDCLSLVALIGFSGLAICSIPVLRLRRQRGQSTYTFWMRLKLALAILSSAKNARAHLMHLQRQKRF